MHTHSPKSIFRWTLASAAVALMVVAAGCRQDMQDEPKMIPQRGTRFFASGRSVRPQVEGTVARNEGDEDDYFHTGLIANQEQDKMPFPVTMTVLLRGQEQFNIYCTPCHSRVGNGRGMIVERGYKPAGDLIEPRIKQEPLGHYFAVISNGYGAMPDYAAQVSTKDRWAIAAYIRALQLSQSATLQDVSPGANVQTLAEVSEQMGYSPNFPEGWTLPDVTNVPSAGDMFPSKTVGANEPKGPEAPNRGVAGKRAVAKGTK
ncbi:MAG TPA: cytochrome c [Acidobacteriaceae bacterium]|nr:cytochrome c [Acidobacteriaceae bacterium]